MESFWHSAGSLDAPYGLSASVPDFARLMVVSAFIVGVGLNHLARQKYNSLEISDE
jgi:hypothetical protein